MNNNIYDTFAEAYSDLLEKVYWRPTSKYYGRDGNVYGIENVHFTITDTNFSLFSNAARKIKNSTVEAECDMLFSVNNEVKYVPWYKPYSFGDTSKSMYGQYIAPQIPKIISLLKKHSRSRQAFISVLNNDNNPYTNVMDVPCAIGVQFIVNKNKLNAVGIMRSQDVYLGTTYDVPMFINLQQVIARELELSCGTYTHIAMVAQVYEQHFAEINRMLSEQFIPVYRNNAITLEQQFAKTKKYMEDIDNAIKEG